MGTDIRHPHWQAPYCVSALHAHLVFVTKYGHAVLAGRHLAGLEEIMRDVCADFETEMAEFNGQILYGVLERGSRIDYVQISASLGVSLLRCARHCGGWKRITLVIRIAHRDVIVAPLARAEAIELVQARRELALLTARLAAFQMTADELAATRHLVESQDEQEALRYVGDAGIPWR